MLLYSRYSSHSPTEASSHSTSLSPLHRDSDGLAAVAVLRVVAFDGDLVYVLGDLESSLRAGEQLLVCVVEFVFAEHRPIESEDPPSVGVALW
jgi:hypothetical protein